MEDQEDKGGVEQSKPFFTIFGEPVIKTKCQRNAMISAIVGGISGGLVAFLFTSSPRKSTRIGVATYFTIAAIYACYCAFEELTVRKQARLIRQYMYETRTANEAIDATSAEVPHRLESA